MNGGLEADDLAVLRTWGAALMRGHVHLEDAEAAAHAAGWRAAMLGLEQPARFRAMSGLETARERVAYVIGYGQARAAADEAHEG